MNRPARPCTEKNLYSISFHIEWDMIVVTVFLSILNQTEFHLVQNRKEMSRRIYPIQCERKWKYSFLCVDQRRHKILLGNDFGSSGELLMHDCLQVRASSKWNLRKHLNGIDPLCKRRQLYIYTLT